VKARAGTGCAARFRIQESSGDCTMSKLTIKLARPTLLAAAMLLASWSAQAADMPVKMPVKAPPIVPVFSWSGFYFGANAGYSWGPWDSTSLSSIFSTASTTASPKVDGWLAGLQAGYNWQFNSLVLGVEADYQLTGERATDTWSQTIGGIFIDDFPATITGTASSEWKLLWFATLRGRAGYAVDDWLFYGTGGLAVGRAKFATTLTTTITFPQGGPAPQVASVSADESKTKWGWTIGAGIEKAFGNNFSAKLEYLYVDLGSYTFVAGTGLDTDVRLRDHILRIGLNYRFGAPVIARY
jgi:outer membrane immunogenic protein